MSFPKPNFSEEIKIKLHQEDRINTTDYTIHKKLTTYNDRFREYFEVEEINKQKIFFAKILRRNKEQNQEENYKRLQTNILNEVNFLRQIRYPTIIKYIGYCPNGIDQKHQPAIVTEYGVNGLLHDVIKNSKDPSQQTGWNDTKKLINIYGITSAISYLHSINVLHRNLNPTNIYETEKLYPLVCNFENAIYLGEDIDIYPDEGNTIGLVIYLAPEIIKEQKYSRSSDIYSLGMIIYEILTGSIPFEGLQPTEVSNKILQGKRPELNSDIPEQWQRLIQSCWSEDPKARSTAEDILRLLEEDQNFIKPTINVEEYKSVIKYIKDFFSNYPQEEEEKDNENEDDSYHAKPNRKPHRKSMMNTSIMKKLQKLNLISEENFYEVFKAIDKKTNKNFLAKVFYVYLDGYQPEEKNKILKKMKNILNVDHPSILKSIDFSEEGFGQEYRPTLVTKFNENISLRDVITKSELISQFNATKKLINIYGIACGMSYLHSHNILHRDLTPTNIIEDSNFYPKIKDFDMNETFESMKTLTKMHEISPYLSPESYTNNEYTQKSEVYSFGMIVYVIMTNELPFDQITNTEYMNNIEHQIRPSFEKFKEEILPTPYRELISRCWNNDPNSRPTFSKIKNELETDPKYITPEADTNEYENYKKTIKESEAKQKSLEEETNNTNDETEPESQHKFSIPSGSSDDDDKKPGHVPGGGGFGGGSSDDDDKKPGHEPDGSGNNSDNNEEEEGDLFEEDEEESDENGEFERPLIIENAKQIKLEKYRKGKRIGNGGCAFVHKATLKKDKSNVKAAKLFKAKATNKDENKIIEGIKHEVCYHSQVSHPSITEFKGYSPFGFKKEQYRPTVMIGFYKNGTLEEVIEKAVSGDPEPGWDDTKRLINIYGIASAMKCLHSKEILHRDLKPANILLDESLYPKLNDFDLSSSFSEAQKDESSIGTPFYMAPEIYSSHKYSEKSDVYAFGITVYEVMTNEFVLRGLKDFNIMYKITFDKYRPPLNKPIPQHYKDLIEKCWSEEPNDRPTFKDIVDQLEKDKSFITENVDKKAYDEYISNIQNLGDQH